MQRNDNSNMRDQKEIIIIKQIYVLFSQEDEYIYVEMNVSKRKIWNDNWQILR